MLGLEWNFATAAVASIVAVLAVLAVRRMWRKGLCDCHKDECGGGCAGCSGCSAADKMVADLQRAANPHR
ncbi:MAG: FeoB-associated Cys-rich membrane protein [Eggerthellaceae bacterium]